MVETDDALNLFVSVSDLIELGLEKVLLGSKYLKVACCAVLHKELDVPYCSLKMYNLLAMDIKPFPCSLPVYQSVIHFDSGIKNGLAELVCGSLLLSLCRFKTGLVCVLCKDRLNKRADDTCNDSCRIDYHCTVSVRPSEASAETQVRVECRACRIGHIELLDESLLCLSYIRSSRKQVCRNSFRQLRREHLVLYSSSHDAHRDNSKEDSERVLHFNNLFAEIENRSLYVQFVRFCLKYGSLIGLAGSFQCFHRSDVLFPVVQGPEAYAQLLVEHQERIVASCYGCNQLSLHSLGVGFALLESCSGSFLCVPMSAEYVCFP